MPEAAESITHGWLATAVQERVPPPPLEIFTLCGPGLLPPAVPLNVTVVGNTANAGVGVGLGVCDDVIASITFTICTGGVAPTAEIVTVPE